MRQGINCRYTSFTFVIDSGRIKGAALDTYEYERGLFPGDYRGKEIDDVLLKATYQKRRYYFNTTYCFLYRSGCQNLIVDALDATMDVLTSGTTKLRVRIKIKLEYYLQLFMYSLTS